VGGIIGIAKEFRATVVGDVASQRVVESKSRFESKNPNGIGSTERLVDVLRKRFGVHCVGVVLHNPVFWVPALTSGIGQLGKAHRGRNDAPNFCAGVCSISWRI